MAEPADWTLDDLCVHLQAAVELELLVIPPYLCALYSLHPGSNEEAALIVRSVVVEEMLHMILAANVLNAVGGKPVVGGEWAPRYPAKIPYHEGPFHVNLLPFGDAALMAFLTIEWPSYPIAHEAPATAEAATPRVTLLAEEHGYSTIGEFYAAIAAGLDHLVARLGETAVFTGKRDRQVGPHHYYASGGHGIEVHDSATAHEAITQIVEQGEGEVTFPPAGEKFDADRDLAHFYRFNELHRRRRYREDDEPANPTGPPIDLDLDAVYPMNPNPRVADYATPELRDLAQACNAVWTRLLGQIHTALNGSPDALGIAVGTMFELKYAACDLLRIPLPGDDQLHAGPTFERV
jgi:Ferritin-like